MKIGIDARFIGPGGTGLGKYTEKLIVNLVKIDKKNEYCIFLRRENWNFLEFPSKNFHKVLADVPWYTLGEQLKLPSIFKQQNLDLLHVPHFNVPIFYGGKFIVTIHDLIHHQFEQEAATTRNPLIFKLKRLGYKTVILSAIKKASKIITPSNFVKKQIIETFKVKPTKIVVTYEAAEEEYFVKSQNSLFARKLAQSEQVKSQNYLVYVGNAYPHKNLEKLLDAFRILTTHHPLPATHLILVCPREVFSERLKQEISLRNLEDRVKVKAYQQPEKLVQLFSQATAYVSSSLSEGFGIPGLNAMAANLPAVCSNIPTFEEVYGDAAFYFDPNDPKDIAGKIKLVINNENVRQELIKKGREQIKKYSWQKMARETLRVYQSINE